MSLRRRTPPTSDPRCGTNAGYQAHHRRDENACDACRKANNEYTASVRDVGQQMARNNTRDRVLSEFARRYPDEYRELFDAEYPRALAEQRAKRGASDAATP